MDENRGYQGKRLQPKKRAAKFWSDYGYLLVTVAVVFVLFKVVFQLAFVPTGSMETTVPSKSLMVCWRLPYVVSDPVPERGEGRGLAGRLGEGKLAREDPARVLRLELGVWVDEDA